MEQNINLLTALPFGRRTILSMQLIVKILLGFIVLLVFISAISWFGVSRQKANLLSLQVQKAKLTQQLVNLRTDLVQGTVEKEVQEYKEMTVAQRELTGIVKQMIAANSGFSAYFTAFARYIIDGVWLQSVTISKDHTVVLSGKALNSAYVLAFLQKLGKAKVFAKKKIHMLRVNKAKPAAKNKDKKAQTPIINFTISTKEAAKL